STAYSSLRASFTISGGVLSNRDFSLRGPYATMTGSGQLDLGNRTIDFKVVPQAGLGGKLSVLSVGVPFRITGSWDRLHYMPDVVGMVGGVFEGVGSAAGSVTDVITGNRTRSKKKSSTLGGVGSLFGIQ